MPDFRAGVGAAHALRGRGGAVAGAFASFSAAIAAFVAAVGLLRVTSLAPLHLAPGISLHPISFVPWLAHWSPYLRVPARVQADGVSDLLRVIVVLGAMVFAVGMVQAAIRLVARAYARQYEIALRGVLGAPRRRLARHFLIEGTTFVLVAVSAGTGLGLIGARTLRRTWPGVIEGTGDVRTALPVVVFAGVFALALFLWPAHRMFRKGWLMDAVAPGARSNPLPTRADPYRILVVVQVAAALMLLTGAGLVLRAALPSGGRAASHVAPEDRLVLSLDGSRSSAAVRARAYALAERRLAGQPEIISSAVASPGTVLGIGPMDRVLAECGHCIVGNMVLPMWSMYAQIDAVGPGFFDTLGVPVVLGREFRRGETAEREAIINQTMADRGFQNQNPIGKHIGVGGWNGARYTIVGVVKDVPLAGIGRPGGQITGVGGTGFETRVTPAVYLSAADYPPAAVDLLVHASAPPAAVSRQLRRALAGIGLSVGPPETLADQRRLADAPLRWFVRLGATLAVLALVLAAFGLHGLMSFTIRLRRREIGIRRAVGATRGVIRIMILIEGASVVAIGAALGLLGSLLLASRLRLLFGAIPAFDPAITGGALLALAAAALVGALAPAGAAAHLHPATAIADE